MRGLGGAVPAGEGNLAFSAVAAALRYRAQAPILDRLMKELGFDGTSLENLVAALGAAPGTAQESSCGTGCRIAVS